MYGSKTTVEYFSKSNARLQRGVMRRAAGVARSMVRDPAPPLTHSTRGSRARANLAASPRSGRGRSEIAASPRVTTLSSLTRPSAIAEFPCPFDLFAF